MKGPNFLQGALAYVILFAVALASLRATTPSIVFLTGFTIPDPGIETSALDINDAGTIVGTSTFEERETHVQGFVRYRNGDYSVIIDPNEGGQGQFTVATAINNSGVIAGYYFNGHADHGFFLSNDT